MILEDEEKMIKQTAKKKKKVIATNWPWLLPTTQSHLTPMPPTTTAIETFYTIKKTRMRKLDVRDLNDQAIIEKGFGKTTHELDYQY